MGYQYTLSYLVNNFIALVDSLLHLLECIWRDGAHPLVLLPSKNPMELIAYRTISHFLSLLAPRRTYRTSQVELISNPMLRRLDGASSIFFEKATSLLDISPPNITSFEREKRSMMVVWNLKSEMVSCEPDNNKASRCED
jgi:hypothetical protein